MVHVEKMGQPPEFYINSFKSTVELTVTWLSKTYGHQDTYLHVCIRGADLTVHYLCSAAVLTCLVPVLVPDPDRKTQIRLELARGFSGARAETSLPLKTQPLHLFI
jgi:hypothetical protein